MILAATIKVDPKPIASWRGYARSLKLTIVQIEALQGFVGLGRSAGHPRHRLYPTVYRATAAGDMLAHENTMCGSDA